MPIDLAAAQAQAPPELPGITAATDGVNVAAVPTMVPQPVRGVVASPMPAVTAAGVQLARFVLSILSAALVVLVAYLWSSDWRFTSNLRLVYKEVMAQTAATNEFPSSASIETRAKSFRDAAADPQLKLSADDENGTRALAATLARLGGISDQSKTALDACIPFPINTASRTATLTKCADILYNAEKAAADAGSLARIRVLTDFAKEVNDQRQSFHTSWFQEAQLILLNLLLPLLTGLFGYIFGTQQASNARTGG